jgi:hypothetical protein
MLALMPADVTAGTNVTGLRNWAASVGEQAQQGASIRQGEGASAGDQMLRGFTLDASLRPIGGYSVATSVAIALYRGRSFSGVRAAE